MPGIVFLSGGQSDLQATAHLNAMNSLYGGLPWELSFSYARALQGQPMEIWSGDATRSRRPRNLPPQGEDEQRRALGDYSGGDGRTRSVKAGQHAQASPSLRQARRFAPCQQFSRVWALPEFREHIPLRFYARWGRSPGRSKQKC